MTPFTTASVFAGILETERGPILRLYEFDRIVEATWQVDLFLPNDDDRLFVHGRADATFHDGEAEERLVRVVDVADPAAPRVTGEARTLGRVGSRPVGVASTLLRLDAEYRTGLEGLSLTGSAVYTGPRPASARPYAQLGGRQLFTEALTTLDIGARYRFRLDGHPVSVRLVLANVFDSRSWKIVAANSYQLNDSRRLAINILADY